MATDRQAAIDHATACRAALAAGVPLPSYTGPSLRGAALGGANLGGANLYGATLGGANLTLASLYGANLSGANLSGASLYGATLGGANLGGANLGGANLGGANLGGANLTDANLTGADLTRANLFAAHLTGADLADTVGLPVATHSPAELRRLVADQIEAHPETHDQSTWGSGDPSNCGTACCVAGWACRLGGGAGSLSVASAATVLLWLDGAPMPSFAADTPRKDILRDLRAIPTETA